MPGPRDQDDRHWRLFQFSQDWGMTLPPSPPQPEPAGIAMSFKSASDDAYAEEYLKLRQSELAVQNSPPKGTRTKKGWGPKFVYAVLNDHVTDCGSPAVGESLIDILHSAGGDVNSPPSEKGGIMHRISRHSPGQQRGKLLETAVRNEQADMVRVLAPHSDAMALDLALPIAIRSHNVEVTSILLGYGASTAQTEESQNAFREICAHAEHCNLVGLIVHSKGRPSPEVVSQALVCAVRAGCVENAIHLSRTIGNGNYNGCEALKVAIAGCRRDLALAVIMGSHPPQRPGVNEAFDVLRQTPMSQGQALEFAEILLLAGAEGDTLSAALIKYGEMGFLDMVQLLVRYGASVEFKKGRVLQKAIKALNMDLLQILLGNESNISPVYASGCVDLLPKDIPFEKRHTLLRMLLRKGAAELALNDALIDAAEAGDAESVELLLNPVFPEISTAHPLHIGPRYSVLSQSTARHETASVDYKNGLALQRAVSRGDVVMTQKLLLGIPNMGTLTAAFPITSNLSRPDRYQIIEAFLEAGLSGPPIDASLHIAIAEDPNERDDDLIHLLLEHGADVNFNGGQGLPSVIELGDVELLTELLGTASQETSANAIASAIQLEDEELRLQIVKLLLEHCAGIALAQVSAALAEVLQEEPADMELLQLLLEEGQADVNAYEGKLLSMALQDPDADVLIMFLNHGKPAPEYITRLIMELAPLPFDQAKINKLHALIDSYQPEGTLSQALDLQVQYALQQQADHNDPCVLEIVKVLLGNGACVDSNNAGVLCHAVASGHAPIFELLMAESPKPQSLAAALPYALALPDLTGRVMMVNKLVASGALPKVVNDLLMDRIQQDPTDMAVLDALAVGAKDVQGQAIMVAIRNHLPDVVNLLIHRTSPTPLILDAALKEALAEEDQLVRFNVCTLLVLAGATEDTISDSLATAATDGDMGLAQMLIERGADPEFNHGAAIVEAARNGLVDMLHLLLDSREEFESDVLEAAFTAATEIENRDIKALLFGPLLEMGLEGPTIDAQLAYTVREGDEAAPLVQILLEGGADPNHNNGEPVVEAINNGHDRLLDMMLGAEELEEEVKELSQATLVNAIGAAWQLEPEDRLEILGKIFDIEIDACPELDAYLNMAVNEEQPENALVELLLENGADPTANQCQTLLQASVRYNHTILSMLLDRDMAPEHLAYVFSHAFGREAAAQWFHEAGLHTAQVLLERGAEGAGPSDALVAVTEAANDENFELADHFVTALLGHGADADHEDGEAIVEAASKAIAPWVHDFLQHDPAVESVSRAFAHIFDEAFPEEADALELVQPFYEWACHAEENHIDFEAVREEREPDEEEDDEEHEEQPPSLLIRGLTLYPGSFEIFHILIELGCNPEETAPCHVNADVEEEEEVSLLVFVLAQPALQVQSQIVHLLLQRGANANFTTPVSHLTPLMLAVQGGRPDIVHMLLLAGADIDATDAMGNTPLALATHLEGEVATAVIGELLNAGAETDDGSLHDAARELNLSTVQVLVRAGHTPDFPSPLHGGRTALGELCLHATSFGPLTPAQEKAMERVIRFLLQSGSDPTLPVDNKTPVILALEADDPVTSVRILLKAGLWKQVNDKVHHYTDGQYTYSPTMYVWRLLPETPHTQALVSLLRANRAVDVFYANKGPQPEDAVGLPKKLEVEEQERLRRAARLASEDEDHARTIRRNKELAKARRDLWKEQVDMEDFHRRLQDQDQLDALRERAGVEGSIQQLRFNSELAHQEALTNAAAARVKLLGDVEYSQDMRRKAIGIEHEKQLGAIRMATALPPPQAQGQIEMPVRQALPAPPGMMAQEEEEDDEDEDDDEDDEEDDPSALMQQPGQGQLVPAGYPQQQQQMMMPRGGNQMMMRSARPSMRAVASARGVVGARASRRRPPPPQQGFVEGEVFDQ